MVLPTEAGLAGLCFKTWMQFSQVVKIEHLIIRVQERQKNVSSGWLKAQFTKDGNQLGHGELNRRKRNNGSWEREGRASQHYLYLRSWQVWILWFENIKGQQNQHSEPWNNPASLVAFGCASSLLVRPAVYLHLFVYSSYIFSSPTHKILRRNSGENVFLA